MQSQIDVDKFCHFAIIGLAMGIAPLEPTAISVHAINMDFSSKAFYDCMADVVDDLDESETGIRMRKFNEEDAQFYIDFMRKFPSLRRLQ